MCSLTITWHPLSAQQFLQQGFLSPLIPFHAPIIPSFFQVLGSIRSKRRKFGLSWTKVVPKQICWTSLRDLLNSCLKILLVWLTKTFLVKSYAVSFFPTVKYSRWVVSFLLHTLHYNSSVVKIVVIPVEHRDKRSGSKSIRKLVE